MKFQNPRPSNVKLKTYTLALLAIVMTVFASTARADTELKFENGVFYGDDNSQQGLGIETGSDGLFVGGVDGAASGKGLAAKFALPPASIPLSASRWNDQRKAKTVLSSNFMDVKATSEGVYFTGYSLMRKSGKVKISESSGVLVKYQAGDLSGPVWEAKPSFYPSQNNEAFYALSSALEGAAPVLYVVGQASARTNNMTALLAKYSSNGKLLWSQTLSDTGELKRGSATSVVVMDNFIYVGGFISTDTEGAAFEQLPLVPTLWKYDATGKQIWMKSLSREAAVFSNAIDSLPVQVAVTAAGSHIYLATPNKTRADKEGDLWIVKYDVSGTKVWENGWIPDDHNYFKQQNWPTSILAGLDRLYISGFSENVRSKNGNPDEDAFLLEMDFDYGSVLAVHRYGQADQSERGSDLALHGKNLYLVGTRKPIQTPKKKIENALKDADAMVLHYSVEAATTVSIDIVPGSSSNKFTPESEGGEGGEQVAVAILSSSDFNAATEVSFKSLTFGRTGYEGSWKSCSLKDVDQSTPIDIECYFKKTWKEGGVSYPLFKKGDLEGILKGQTRSGARLFGKDKIKFSTDADSSSTSSASSAASTDTNASSTMSDSSSTILSSTAESTDTSPPSTPSKKTDTATSTSSSATSNAADDSTSTSADEVVATTTEEIKEMLTSTANTDTQSVAKEDDSPTLSPLIYSTSKGTASSETTSTAALNPEPILKEPIKSYQEPTVSETQFLQVPEKEMVLISSSSLPSTSTFTSTSSYKVATDSQIAARNEYLQKFLHSGATSPSDRLVSRENYFESRKEYLRDEVFRSDEPQTGPVGGGLAHAYADLGKEALRKGQIDEAMIHFREALTMDPENVEIRNEIGVALFEQGKLQEAAAYFSEVLRLNPDDQIARSKLDAINARLGQVSQ